MAQLMQVESGSRKTNNKRSRCSMSTQLVSQLDLNQTNEVG